MLRPSEMTRETPGPRYLVPPLVAVALSFILAWPVRWILAPTGLSDLSVRLMGTVAAEWIAVAFIAWIYLRHGSSLRKGLFGAALRWWDFLLVPLFLYLVGAILFQLGASLGRTLVAGVDLLAPESFAIVPSSGVELFLAGAAALTAGFCEEVVFRGFLMRRLAHASNPWMGSVLSLLIFGILHYRGWGWVGVFAISFWAIPYTAYVAKTGKLVPAIIAHALNDLIAFVVIAPLMNS